MPKKFIMCCWSQRIKISRYIAPHGKRRIQFVDANHTVVDLPLTSVNYPYIDDCALLEEVLILVGLGRPYAGNSFRGSPALVVTHVRKVVASNPGAVY